MTEMFKRQISIQKRDNLLEMTPMTKLGGAGGAM
jgi:hypothetical protein